MINDCLKSSIKSYKDFPKKGIFFRDIFPILVNPNIFTKLIEDMASQEICKVANSILAIDARGFLFGSAIALKLHKPLTVARKPGKLPGDLISASYSLEYGTNSLSIQKELIEPYDSFVIVDDLLATGGTVKCVSELLYSQNKHITGLSTVIELEELNGRKEFNFPVESQVIY